MKKLLAALLSSVMVLSFAGCSSGDQPSAKETEDNNPSETTQAKDVKIGVSMPTKSLQRWNQDGANMKSNLEEKGYEVDLQFAENKVEAQVSQIENMITKGAEIVVIGAIDGSALTSVLETAKAADVQVIAYDRLIMNSDAVSYYATFDNYQVGQIQGKYIVDALDLDNAEGPFNLEISTGPMDDNNVVYFFGGAMDVLQPYIDEGKLVIKSAQTTREQCATPNWDEKEAQSRMDNIITAHYTDANIDAVLCSNDSTSLGVQSALKSAGYGSDDKPMPIVTGQDANIANVKAIIAGEQSMSVFKDTRALAGKVCDMVDAIVEGTEPPVNDTETYDNGVKVVPSYLLAPVFVDSGNYQELLLDSGYYTQDQLK